MKQYYGHLRHGAIVTRSMKPCGHAAREYGHLCSLLPLNPDLRARSWHEMTNVHTLHAYMAISLYDNQYRHTMSISLWSYVQRGSTYSVHCCHLQVEM